MKYQAAQGLELTRQFEKRLKRGLIDIDIEIKERERRYEKHRGYGPQEKALVIPPKEPSRPDIPSSTVYYGRDGNVYLDGEPMQSQAIHLTSALPDAANSSAPEPIARPLAPGAMMPRPRMKRWRDGRVFVKQDKDEMSDISNASWPDFQSTIEEKIEALER